MFHEHLCFINVSLMFLLSFSFLFFILALLENDIGSETLYFS